MTEKLYDKDSYITEFEATVLSCEAGDGCYFTVLDKTAFFPEGGGQPSDKGYLNDAEILDVQIKDGIIYHKSDKAFAVGETVNGKIDFGRRFDFMQQHSAEHIVSGVAHSLYGCENVGFHLSEDIVTVDFDKPLTKEEIAHVEAVANRKVFENNKICAFYPDSQTLKTISYRAKKEIEGDVRIVSIENVDACACCAPHVNSTGEVGIIKFLSAEKLRGGVRLEMKAGNRAYEDYLLKHENTAKISALLCVKPENTAKEVERLCGQISALKAEILNYKRQAIAEKAAKFAPEKEITAEFEEGFEIKELQTFADALYKKAGGVRAVFSKKEDSFAFVICGEEQSLSRIFADFKAAFSVKGGGRGTIVQGTVFAEKSKISEFFGC